MRRISYADIPLHSGGADGVETRVSDDPLIRIWKERNGAVERVVRVRPLDFYDLHPGPTEFDEILDLYDERARALRPERRWFVARSSEHFNRAEQELYLIANFYQEALTKRKRVYLLLRQCLLDAGYPASLVDAIPEPPDEIPALHLINGCTGEIHIGRVKEGSYRGNTFNFCTACGYVFIHAYGPNIPLDILEDVGVKLIPQDPDGGYYQSVSDADEIPPEELKRAEREAQDYTRRCMRIAGTLISVSEAAEILGSTTQNVSGYIARQRLHAWPDPDDPRHRLVLKSEVEALKEKQNV